MAATTKRDCPATRAMVVIPLNSGSETTAPVSSSWGDDLTTVWNDLLLLTRLLLFCIVKRWSRSYILGAAIGTLKGEALNEFTSGSEMATIERKKTEGWEVLILTAVHQRDKCLSGLCVRKGKVMTLQHGWWFNQSTRFMRWWWCWLSTDAKSGWRVCADATSEWAVSVILVIPGVWYLSLVEILLSRGLFTLIKTARQYFSTVKGHLLYDWDCRKNSKKKWPINYSYSIVTNPSPSSNLKPPSPFYHPWTHQWWIQSKAT